MDSRTDEHEGAQDPLADPTVVEAIARFDELEPTRREALEQSPRVQAVIRRLERVDRWLEGNLADGRPEAELLYDVGGGPGARSRTEDERSTVAAHLAADPAERGWVEGLRSAPPSPLILDPLPADPEDEAQPRLQQAPAMRPVPAANRNGWSPSLLTWAPMAAAALLLAMALGGGVQPTVLDGHLPRSPIVRGDDRPGPLFPRGRILSGGAFALAPILEFIPVDRAAGHRVELTRLSSGGNDPFEVGQLIWSGNVAPETSAPISALEDGRYEWRLFATTDGIEAEVGSESFRVVPGHTGLEAAASGQGDDALADAVALHAAGFLTDARHRARALPTSDERERYLTGR